MAPLVSGTPFGHLSKTHQTPPRCTRGHFHTLRAFELPVQEVRDLRIHRGRVFAREIDVVIWVCPAEDRKLRAMPSEEAIEITPAASATPPEGSGNLSSSPSTEYSVKSPGMTRAYRASWSSWSLSFRDESVTHRSCASCWKQHSTSVERQLSDDVVDGSTLWWQRAISFVAVLQHLGHQ